MHAYSLRQEIILLSDSGIKAPYSTIYDALHRLEAKGFASKCYGDWLMLRTERRLGLPYELTYTGKEIAGLELSTYKRLVRAADYWNSYT